MTEKEILEQIKNCSRTDWCGVVFILSILILIILFGGEPDLMDAIIERISNS